MPKKKRDLTGAPMRRIWHIHSRISRGDKTNAEKLARELEVSSRTIKRDIEDMVEQLGVPIVWDDGLQAYRYNGRCDTLPYTPISGREALVYAAAGYVFAGSGGAFGRMLGTVLQKLAPLLGGVVSISFDSVAQALSTHVGSRVDEFRHFLPLLEACLGRQQLRLGYRALLSDAVETRTVQPLHLAERAQRWVLFAFDENRRAIRTFRLSRVRSVKRTGKVFPPRKFDPAKLLRGSLGRFAGEREVEVRIALDAIAERYVRETPWHETQVITKPPGGGPAVLTLQLNNLVEVTNIVLSWGEHVEVLSPPELRAEARRRIAATLARYDDAASS